MMTTLKPATLRVVPEVIRAYAELTEDYNPLHLDPEFAARTPMGGVIAHGTMSISLLWQALQRTFGPQAFDLLDLDVRFLKPVRLEETLTAGGQPNAENPELLDVWVRGDDGVHRVAGTVRRRAVAG